MTGGYAGKIVRVNLTTKSISTIDTEQYEDWGGGHGIGSAIFWDLAGDQLPFAAFDPKNVVTIMGGPFSGVVVPTATGRCEVQGVGAQSSPIEWFTRSNFGGRFSQHLKYAGWDGIVVEGASDTPVWINIINDKVTIEDASTLWGLGIMETQEDIWRRVTGNARFGEWWELDSAYSTQRPAVLAIGQLGENMGRIGALVHDAGNGAGQGGFGGVWGSKKLKAISVIGNGSVPVADPQALMAARLWYRQFQYDVDDGGKVAGAFVSSPVNNMGAGDTFWNMSAPYEPARAQACAGCSKACRQRLASGFGNESSCEDTIWAAFGTAGPTRRDMAKATDLGQDYGINVYEPRFINSYLRTLYQEGVIGAVGSGAQLESSLPFGLIGTRNFIEAVFKQMAYKEELGADLADGCYRAAVKWGRIPQDTDSGVLAFPYWGYHQHYDPRTSIEWGYGSILGDRDINEHTLNFPLSHQAGAATQPAEKVVDYMAAAVAPYEGDPFMFDYSADNIYSDHWVKTVAWHRHYARFWIQSALFCDWVWPTFITTNTIGEAADGKGATPEGEPMFYNAVTGKNITFADGVEIGRRIWNLDKSIWVLQGRHRDQEVFAGYVYDVPAGGNMPVYKDGAWSWARESGRTIDRVKFEEWKTKFFNFEGWNPDNGWPKRAVLEELDLKDVADTLQSKSKLG